ncbi:hypothetical protein HPT25_19640 [Bacillus sp. BRMEA1]|uniref:YkoP family protein n=1 Tax=Neobacillus endophyticus TaxID=2738405 RepID=UPI0015644229|nr:hypothetical protein [Neobacillus endophyticus]NRD79577.1 hypothetical protein [Neobacillus endophyticus]
MAVKKDLGASCVHDNNATRRYKPRKENQSKSDKQVSESKVNWKKKLLITFWIKWEKVIYKFFQIQPIDENQPFLNARVRTYFGKTILLSDGEVIKRGDQVLELHLNNDMLFKMGMHARSPMQLAIQMIRITEQLLPKTLQFILNHPKYEKIKGVYGVSMIHRGSTQFGFTVVDLPKGLFLFLTKLYLHLLLLVFHPQGKRRMQNKRELLVPKIIAISTKEFICRYTIESLSTSPRSCLERK